MKQSKFPNAMYSFLCLTEKAREDLYYDLCLLYPNLEAVHHYSHDKQSTLLVVIFPDFPPGGHGDLIHRMANRPIWYKTPAMKDFLQVIRHPEKVTA